MKAKRLMSCTTWTPLKVVNDDGFVDVVLADFYGVPCGLAT